MSDNEQMNENRETIDDIVFELREHDHEMIPPYLCFDEEGGVIIGALADRIEAAWKRESKAIATEHAVLPAVCITKPHGNEAAMRETLVAVKKSIDGIGESSLDCDPTILMVALTQVCARMSARIKRALSEPARNCDRPECATSKAAQDVWRKEDGGKTSYYEWIFAPATEREGDCDGR